MKPEQQRSQTPSRSAKAARVATAEPQLDNLPELIDYAKAYAREKPEVVALWCFGIGFVLGWKLKPW